MGWGVGILFEVGGLGFKGNEGWILGGVCDGLFIGMNLLIELLYLCGLIWIGVEFIVEMLL